MWSKEPQLHTILVIGLLSGVEFFLPTNGTQDMFFAGILNN